MNTVSMLFKNGAQWQLHFKEFKNAEEVYRRISGATGSAAFIEVSDDYGLRGMVSSYDLMLVSLGELSRQFEAQADIAVLQARGQVMVQRRASADPMVRLGLGAAGPPLVS